MWFLALPVPFCMCHVLRYETKMEEDIKEHFAFAEEKLRELSELKEVLSWDQPLNHPAFQENANLFTDERICGNPAVRSRIGQLGPADFQRVPVFDEREKQQKHEFGFLLLPTTTIGSFPQTKDVRANRAAYKKGQISEAQYKEFNREKIKECIRLQEDIGLDVLVNGEYERNDMVEYFGECLDGFLFTEKAWVQSYGTRCVKPPIVWGDISRSRPMTVEYSTYAKVLH